MPPILFGAFRWSGGKSFYTPKMRVNLRIIPGAALAALAGWVFCTVMSPQSLSTPKVNIIRAAVLGPQGKYM